MKSLFHFNSILQKRNINLKKRCRNMLEDYVSHIHTCLKSHKHLICIPDCSLTTSQQQMEINQVSRHLVPQGLRSLLTCPNVLLPSAQTSFGRCFLVHTAPGFEDHGIGQGVNQVHKTPTQLAERSKPVLSAGT